MEYLQDRQDDEPLHEEDEEGYWSMKTFLDYFLIIILHYNHLLHIENTYYNITVSQMYSLWIIYIHFI
jgi:hypothetical protein